VKKWLSFFFFGIDFHMVKNTVVIHLFILLLFLWEHVVLMSIFGRISGTLYSDVVMNKSALTSRIQILIPSIIILPPNNWMNSG
jgi:hypothetical protein